MKFRLKSTSYTYIGVPDEYEEWKQSLGFEYQPAKDSHLLWQTEKKVEKEFSSLEELVRFAKDSEEAGGSGNLVISIREDMGATDEVPVLEIYDDYRE